MPGKPANSNRTREDDYGIAPAQPGERTTMAVKFAKGVSGRAGKNVWVRWGGREGETVIALVQSETRPEGEWSPFYPAGRVRGDTYTYYNGRSEWEIEANAAMASEANSNFRRQESY